jgi:hypothetical protein
VPWVDDRNRIELGHYRNERHLATLRVYDVQDLLHEAERVGSQFPVRRFKRYATWQPITSTAAAEEDFRELIIGLVDPISWQRVGGGAPLYPQWGSFQIIDGRAIITQSPAAHRKIEVLLAALRARPSRAVTTGEN